MNYSELADIFKTTTFETERLILRPYRDRDEDGLLELFRDRNTMRMDGDSPIYEKNREFARRTDLIKHGPLIWLFAEERESSGFVGYVLIQDESDAVALGFAVTAAKQHMGYGHEMIGAVTDMLFDCGIGEIRIKTWEKNLPCRKLAEKLGFEQLRIIKDDHRDPVTGEVGDCVLYSRKRTGSTV